MVKIEEPDEKVYKTNEIIPKKTAAQEVYTITSGSRVMGFIMIASVFVTAVVSAFSQWAGALTAGLVSMGAAVFIWRDTNRMKYLAAEYGLGVAKSAKKEI